MTDLSEYERAMQILDDLAKDYEVWVQDDLKSLHGAFERACLAQGQDRKDIMQKEVFRVAHDMKGQGATFGYDLITDIGNHLCRYIEKQDVFGQNEIDAVKKHIDAMTEILNTHLKADGGEKGQYLKEITEAL